MKKYLFLILLFINSCENIDESDLDLNVDPLSEAYRKSDVDYYLKSVTGKDTVYYKDSTCVNKKGLVTLKKTIHGYSNTTSYIYDKLNRLIRAEHQSDIYYKIKVAYAFDENSNNLTGYNFAYDSGTKSFSGKPVSITYFKFRNRKLVTEILIDTESKDTVMTTSYKYTSKNKISEISKNNLADKYKLQTKYKYRKNNTLSEIIGEGEVKYISEKTGLIDSVKGYPGEKTIYTYHFRI